MIDFRPLIVVFKKENMFCVYGNDCHFYHSWKKHKAYKEATIICVQENCDACLSMYKLAYKGLYKEIIDNKGIALLNVRNDPYDNVLNRIIKTRLLGDVEYV
jgi:hypothetical protein